MIETLLLFADDAAKGNDGLSSFLSSPMMPIMAVMILFIFFIVLPAQRRQRQQQHEQEQMIAQLKKNDEVVTAGGIIGIVAHIKESGDEITLKIDDNARMRVLKSSIVRVLKQDGVPVPVPGAPAAANTNIKPSA